MESAIIIVLVGGLQGGLIYLVLSSKLHGTIDTLNNKLSDSNTRLLIVESQLNKEQSVNGKLNSALMALERDTSELKARLSVLVAENRELKRLVSHGGRVMSEALANRVGATVIINSEAVKAFLSLIKQHGYNDYE